MHNILCLLHKHMTYKLYYYYYACKWMFDILLI